MSGTSIATSLVTGVAAIHLQREPYLIPEQLKHKLLNESRIVSRGRRFAGRRISLQLLRSFPIMSSSSLAAQPLAKNGGSGNTTILKLFCRNAINKLRGWWETLVKVN